jgi:aldose 1-epimerase
MVELEAGEARVRISPLAGGRVASIEVGGTELLITGDIGDDPMLWGSYPMVPYAGRVRDAQFLWDGRVVHLPTGHLSPNLAPHAIHGTGFIAIWDVVDQGPDHAELRCDLAWSRGGFAHQHVQLLPDALVCVLTVSAGALSMPATIGWHPWFRKPLADDLRFESMYRRGDDGLPTGELITPTTRPWDDCFVGPLAPPRLQMTADLSVAITSDCDHWVVYDEPAHATCVEPQSGPPDAFNLGRCPRLEPGEMLQRTMTIAWQRSPAERHRVTER